MILGYFPEQSTGDSGFSQLNPRWSDGRINVVNCPVTHPTRTKMRKDAVILTRKPRLLLHNLWCVRVPVYFTYCPVSRVLCCDMLLSAYGVNIVASRSGTKEFSASGKYMSERKSVRPAVTYCHCCHMKTLIRNRSLFLDGYCLRIDGMRALL